MNIARFALNALVGAGFLFTCALPASASEPLPEKQDIPSGYSTVICPNEASARALIADYYRLNDKATFDTYYFFDGLKATGCEQSGGPIVIEQVLVRKQIGAVHQIVYRGSRPTGGTVFGLVDEEGNNQTPRNDFERWIETYATGGFINPSPRKSPRQKPTYLCPSPRAAQNVVAAIPPARERGVMNARQVKAKLAALRASGCTIASGRYRVTAVHSSVFVSLGNEAGETWTALTAVDDRGRVIGLLHDDDLMTDWN